MSEHTKHFQTKTTRSRKATLAAALVAMIGVVPAAMFAPIANASEGAKYRLDVRAKFPSKVRPDLPTYFDINVRGRGLAAGSQVTITWESGVELSGDTQYQTAVAADGTVDAYINSFLCNSQLPGLWIRIIATGTASDGTVFSDEISKFPC